MNIFLKTFLRYKSLSQTFKQHWDYTQRLLLIEFCYYRNRTFQKLVQRNFRSLSLQPGVSNLKQFNVSSLTLIETLVVKLNM